MLIVSRMFSATTHFNFLDARSARLQKTYNPRRATGIRIQKTCYALRVASVWIEKARRRRAFNERADSVEMSLSLWVVRANSEDVSPTSCRGVRVPQMCCRRRSTNMRIQKICVIHISEGDQTSKGGNITGSCKVVPVKGASKKGPVRGDQLWETS